MGIWESILLALGLCADCFAVSLCSSITLRKIEWKSVLGIALAFAIIQAGLLLIGWAFGELFVGLVHTLSHIIAFALLFYVGASMLVEAIKAMMGNDEHVHDLSSFRNVLLAGVATSIDAAAIGVAQSMIGLDWSGILPLFIAVFVITFASVVAGIWGGKTIGSRFGHWAEVAGGIVLIGLAVYSIFI